MKIAKTLLRSFYTFFIALGGMLLLTLPIVYWELHHPGNASSNKQIFEQHHFLFTFIRWLFIGAFIGLWPVIIRRLGNYQQWEPAKVQFWLAQRWRFTMWLVLVELIFLRDRHVD